MLDSMRRQSYLIYLVFGGIIFIFAINFGPGSSGCMNTPTQTWAAKINGETIRQQEFAVGYSRQMDYMRHLAEQSGVEFDNAMAERFGIRHRVMEQLVERRLLAQEAHRRGILVSDDDLLNYLRTQYGVKDVTYDIYENWVLRTFATNVETFEEQARGDVAAQRMAQLVNDLVEVGDLELKEAFTQMHDRAKMQYAAFAIDSNAVAKPTTEQVKALLEQDKAAVAQAYESDSFAYMTPLQVEARQIFRRLPADASAARVEQERALLEDLAQKIEQGADFAELAKAHSEDPNGASHGGQMGWVEPGQLVQALDRALFQLPPQGVTPEPVRSPEGLHLLQVTQIQTPKRQPLDTVQETVAEKLLRTRAARVVAQKQADTLLAQLKQGTSWDKLTVAAANDSMPGMQLGQMMHKAAVKIGAAKARPERQVSAWIHRAQPNMGALGTSASMHAALFALDAKAPLAQSVFEMGDAFYVMALDTRETPDMTAFAQEREDLYHKVLEQKRAQVLKEWVAYLRVQAKVEINTALVNAPLMSEQDMAERS